ncbi:hypothetical protein Rsub_12088 [Raphidocelis subcapitata]|uniref:Mediator of RNA polymerase II transcription subunit 21 n=1 Tax=Raphidocelis subcapitata TaxID=307507 RepID=A0A2V0PPC0_9CHLO|nr:hypothetical protein Rsub_12088 [Raphidocelis subcapitata]|eukprot:GBF99307.1 hypothetical protein Rsub_12088 [Raphidocelis subcapitata]
MASADLVTQLQDQLHTVSKMFFDFVGILQRDAPPLPLDGEPLAPPPTAVTAAASAAAPGDGGPPAFDVEATTQLMASQLIAQFKATEALISALPPAPGPDGAAASDRARALQEEHAAVSAALDAAAAEAEAQLGELQRLFAELAAARLRDARAGVALPPLPAVD